MHLMQDYTFAVFPRIDKVKCDIFNSTVGPTSLGEDEIPPVSHDCPLASFATCHNVHDMMT
jgi:hypothetical protein